MGNLDYFLESQKLIKFLTDIKNYGLKQAYLFSSNDKQKNEASSIIFSLIINCKNNLCLTCNSCTKILSNNFLDVISYPKNKNINVEDIEEIIDSCYILPLESEYKIYILNNFDEANISSQNKFLKTLEEPPKNVIFILNSTRKNMVLDTIKSRCEIIDLPNFDLDEIKLILQKNNINLDTTIIENSNNELGNYLTLKQNDFANTFDFCLNMLKNLSSSGEILDYASQIGKNKDKLENYFLSLVSLFSDILIVKYDKNKVKNKSKLKDLIILSEKYSEKAINEILKNIILLNKQLLFNTNENLIIDSLLINILEEKHKWN